MSQWPIRSVFLTTFNRPALLAQSLPEILRQSFDCGLPVLIRDDGSTDPDTLAMLEDASKHELVTLSGRVNHDGLHAHLSTGRNFLEGVMDLMHQYGPEGAAFLKVDDDIVLAPDAIHRIIKAWNRLQPLAPVTLSAMVGPHTRVESECFPDAVLVDSSCSTCCVHRLDLWRDCIQEVGIAEIVKAGWDTIFFWGFLHKLHPDKMRCFATKPSLVYHAGHTGVHLIDTDHNRLPPDPFAFPGEWLGGMPASVQVQRGDLESWKVTYADRLTVPGNG